MKIKAVVIDLKWTPNLFILLRDALVSHSAYVTAVGIEPTGFESLCSDRDNCKHRVDLDCARTDSAARTDHATRAAPRRPLPRFRATAKFGTQKSRAPRK